MRADIRSYAVASLNAQDGVSLVQTAEGALNEVSNILGRMRELSMQSANGTLSNTDRATLDTEFQQLISEIDRISSTTEFNGVELLDGTSDLDRDPDRHRRHHERRDQRLRRRRLRREPGRQRVDPAR